jgi:hypothetical protein
MSLAEAFTSRLELPQQLLVIHLIEEGAHRLVIGGGQSAKPSRPSVVVEFPGRHRRDSKRAPERRAPPF